MNLLFNPSPLSDNSKTSVNKKTGHLWKGFLSFLLLTISCLLPGRSMATLVTIGAASSSTSTVIGLYAYNKYSSGESIYKPSEVGTAGIITSFALNKASGTYVSAIDSVYVFMKETSTYTLTSPSTTSGYTLVYSGDFTNATTSGWQTVTLATPFTYTGAGNLNILIVRHNGTAITSGYPNYYYDNTPGTPAKTYYYSTADYWTGWGTSSATASSGYTTTYYKTQVQLNFNPFPACSGKPTAGTAVASTTTACAGTPVAFSLTGTSLSSAITYSWDTSSTGTSGWNVAGTSTTFAGAWSFTPPLSRSLYYRCRVTCGSLSDTSTTLSVTVGSILLPPYTETFESGTPGVNMPCAAALPQFTASTSYSGSDYWKLLNSVVSGYSGTNHTTGGANYLVAGYYCGTYYSSTYPPGYWFTPGIQLTAGKSYRFSYWYRVGDYMAINYVSTGCDFGMYYNTAQSTTGLTAIVPDLLTKASATYAQNVGDFSVPTTGVYYLAVKANNKGYGYYGGGVFDDLNLIELPACNTATALGSGGHAISSPGVACSVPSTVSLSLTGSPAYSGLYFSWEVSVGSTAGPWVKAGISSASGSYTIPAGGTYYFRCKDSCGTTGVFTYSDTTTVLTAPLTPPYTETFESGTAGVNMPCASNTSTWGTTPSYWNILAAPYSSSYPTLANHTPGGSKYLTAGYILGSYSTGSDEYWFTPGLALTAAKSYNVSFWFNGSGYSTGSTVLGVAVGTAQTKAAMTITAGLDTTVNTTTYTQLVRNFISPTTGTYYVGIKINNKVYSYPGLAIDDIGVNQLPSCSAKPVAGTTMASPSLLCSSTSTARISLAGTSAASDLSFRWQMNTGSGYADISGATLPAYTTTTPAAAAYYRCIVTCPLITGANVDTSVAVFLGTAPITPPYTETFESGTAGTNMPCASNTSTWGSTPSYWNLLSGPYSSSYPTLVNHTPGGSKYLSAGYALGTYSTGSDEYWFTPGLALTSAKAYNVSFWFNGSGYSTGSTVLGIAAGTTQTKAGMTIAAGSDTTVNTTTYTQLVRSFIAPTTATYYVGIKINNKVYSYPGLAIDDIGINQLPSCSAKPVAGKATAFPSLLCATTSVATVSLLGTSAASDLTFQWQMNTGSGYTNISAATLPTYTTTTPAAAAYYRCIVTCPLITGANVDTSVAFFLGTTPITPPYTETFEAGVAGTNMPCASNSSTWGSTPSYWNLLSGAYSPSYPTLTNHTAGGSKYLSAGYALGTYSTGSDEYWFTPALLLTAAKSYNVSFWYNGSGYSGGNTVIGIAAGTTQTKAGMTIAVGADTTVNTTTYTQFVRNLISPTTGVYYVGIKVNNKVYSYPGLAIDDIGINQMPSCSAKPVAGTTMASPGLLCSTTSVATVSLLGTSAASDLTFQWQKNTGSGYTNISAATLPTYTTTTPAAAAYYRCIVTCPLMAGANVDTSVAVFLGTIPITPPYVETFESGTAGVNMPCASNTSTWGSTPSYWNLLSGPYSSSYPTLTNHTSGGSKYLSAGYALGSYSTGKDEYWFSPAISLTAGSTYEGSFWYNGSGYSSGATTLGMYYGTAQTAAAMTTPVLTDVVGANTSVYRQLLGRFLVSTTGTYYLGIKVNNTVYSYPGVAIDDIGLTQLPPCTGAPTVGTLAAAPSLLCSPGTVKLSMDLSGVSKVSGLSYRWESSTSGPASGFGPLSGVLTSPAYTSPTISTGTWFRCIVKCTLTGDSTISSALSVGVGAVTPPYVETFESVTPGTNAPCASYTSGWSSGYLWYTMGSPYSTSIPGLDNHTAGGSRWLFGGYYISLGSTSDYWFTPGLNLTGGKLYQFSYWYSTDGYVYAGYPFQFGAYMGTAQTAAAMTTAIGPVITPGSPSTYQQYVTRFTPASSGVYYIGIYGKSNYEYGFAIDDIGLQEVPACSAPVVAGTIKPNPTYVCSSGGTTSLDLSGSTLATGLNYDWYAAPAAAGPYVATGGTTLPYTTDPLAANTWFRVVVTCPASGLRDTSAAFMIGVGGRDMPYTEDFESTPAGQKPLCSDATTWGTYYYDGWNVYAGTYTGAYTNHTPGGKKHLIGGYYLGYSTYSPTYTTVTDENYWFTPGFNMRGGYKYELSFWYLGASSPYYNRMGVFYGNSQTPSAMTGTILPFRIINNTSYTQFDTMFTIPKSGTYYLGFKKSSGVLGAYNYYGVAFDDINLNYAPCSGTPFAGTVVSSVPSGTAKCVGTRMTLTDIGATINLVPGIKYHWQRRGLGGASPITWRGVAGARDTILSADTLVGYEYRLAVICTNTNDTAFSVPFQLPAQAPHPAVSIAPTTTPVTYCLGDTVRFTATNFSGATYDWMVDSVVVPGWKFSDFGATDPGTVMVKVTSPLSVCPAWSNTVKMIANDPGYTVSITKPSDSIICTGSSVVLTAVSSKAGVTYQWRKDNVNISGATGATYLVTTGGYYRVMTSDGVSACPAASRNVQIIVKPNPPAVITVPGGTTTACENEGVQLNANTGGYSYEWTRGGSTIVGWTDSAQIIKNSGTYAVKVRTPDGCVTTSSSVIVNILPSPVPVITKTVTGTTIVLSTGFYPSWQWYRNGVLISGATAQTFNPLYKGVYKVRVVGTNNCAGESNPIELMEDFLGISNAGTVNDQIKVYPSPTTSKVYIESPIEVKVKVKDMSGRTVYEEQVTKEVDLSKYADGVYLFMISDKSGNELIKQQRVSKISK